MTAASTTSPAAPVLNVALAASLSHRMRLRNVLCVRLAARRMGQVTNQDSLSFDMPPVDVRWTVSERVVHVLLPLVVELREKRDEQQHEIARIVDSLRIDYEITEGEMPVDESIGNFAALSGFMHVWPYLRADVQWLTAKLNLPPLTLPLIVSGQVTQHIRSVQKVGASDASPALVTGPDGAAPESDTPGSAPDALESGSEG